jgi:hypothetical protein
MAAHRLTDITVVADAGMLSEANKKAIEAAGLGFILGNRIGHIHYVVDEWCRHNPHTEIPDGLTLTQPWPGGPNSTRRDQVVYYQYRADRARRTLKGIDEQVAKAERAVIGKAPSNATGSSHSPAARSPSTESSNARPAPWPAGRATSPTSPTPHRSS